MSDISYLAATDGEFYECFETVKRLMHNEAYWASLADWVKTVGQNAHETIDEAFEQREKKNLATLFDAGQEFLAYVGLIAITRELVDREVFARNQKEGWPE